MNPPFLNISSVVCYNDMQAALALERGKTERLLGEISNLGRQLNEQRAQLEAVTDELRITQSEARSDKVSMAI